MKQASFFIVVFTSLVANAQQDNIYCQLRDFLAIESKFDSTLTCVEAIQVNDILTDSNDLSVNFAVYSFSSNLIADSFIHYLVKHRGDYFIFSAKDPMLVTNKLLELQEKYPDEISLDLTIRYIRKIGKTRASNMSNYMVISKKIGKLEYIYASGRYK